MTKKLSQSVLDKIKKDNVAPKPKWHFIVKNGLFWMAFIVAAIIGGRAIGVIIFGITTLDLGLIPHLHRQIITAIQVVPLFWIIFFLIFILLATLGLHQTDKGYKISTAKLIGLNLVISLVIGFGAHAIGDSERFEDFFERRAPFYEGMDHQQEKAWNNPEHGTLAGMITEVKDDKLVILEDRTGKIWEVKYEEAGIEIVENIRVKAIGEKEGPGRFEAEIIAPFNPMHGKMKENFHRMRSK